jgi:hypothetical protein
VDALKFLTTEQYEEDSDRVQFVCIK